MHLPASVPNCMMIPGEQTIYIARACPCAHTALLSMYHHTPLTLHKGFWNVTPWKTMTFPPSPLSLSRQRVSRTEEAASSIFVVVTMVSETLYWAPFQKAKKHFNRYHPRTRTLLFYRHRHGFATELPTTVARISKSTSQRSSLKRHSGFHSLGAQSPQEFGEICSLV